MSTVAAKSISSAEAEAQAANAEIDAIMARRKAAAQQPLSPEEDTSAPEMTPRVMSQCDYLNKSKWDKAEDGTVVRSPMKK